MKSRCAEIHLLIYGQFAILYLTRTSAKPGAVFQISDLYFGHNFGNATFSTAYPSQIRKSMPPFPEHIDVRSKCVRVSGQDRKSVV